MQLCSINFYLLIIASFIAQNASYAQNRVKWVTPEKISEKITKGDKMYIIYFQYHGCKWCKELENTTLLDDHTARFINQNFYPVRINAAEKIEIGGETYKTVKIDKFEFNEFAVEMLNGRMSFPSIVFLNEKFEKVGVYQNYYAVEDLQKLLAYYAGQHYKNTLFRHYSDRYCKDSHFNNLVHDK